MSQVHYAHSPRPTDPDKKHRLAEHLIDTGERAAAFLESVGCADYGRAAGLLHDLGKYTREFQSRLDGQGSRVDHSTAGAKIACDRYPHPIGKILAYCVAGHHAGLANGASGMRVSSLIDRLRRDIPQPDPVWKREIALPDLAPPPLTTRNRDTAGFCAAFLIRMVFSALVDADYLDTEAWFAEPGEKSPRLAPHPSLAELQERLDRHLRDLSANAPPGEVNTLRQEVLAHAREKALEAPGQFTMTVPTGGGKTLASLAFALRHAVRHGLDRVIYVIPFTSIVEQTASVFREALGEDSGAGFVLEHHSAFTETEETRDRERQAMGKLRLAMENWDVPIVVTTAVQFFESLFANRPARCRKLHNIANSVVILDEAQTLPLRLLMPCVTALDELSRNWRASILLCTATQPALSESDGFPRGFDGLREIAPDPGRLYTSLRRTRLQQHAEPIDDTRLAGHLRESPQVLCIVNTRRHARELYEAMGDTEGAAHLTTTMCPLHRRDALQSLRKDLAAGKPVRLIATSLVEAGVDVDFPVVWRAEAGLESIVQAAGRCNREGKRPRGDIHVFTPEAAEGRKAPPEVRQFADVARGVLRGHDDPLSLEAIRDYFHRLYWVKENELDAKGILDMLREQRSSLDFPFETIAREFQVIESGMLPVIVPYRGAAEPGRPVEQLLAELEDGGRAGGINRDLQPYVVQVPPKVRAALIRAGAAQVVQPDLYGDQFVRLANRDLYRSDIGLTWDDPTFLAAESQVH